MFIVEVCDEHENDLGFVGTEGELVNTKGEAMRFATKDEAYPVCDAFEKVHTDWFTSIEALK